MRQRTLRLRSRAAALISTAAVVVAGMVPAPAAAATAEAATCEVQLTSTVSDAGFTHPGVGLTAPILENARDQIAAGAQPWTGYLEGMQRSGAAATTVTSSNRSSTDPTKPASDAFNSQGFNSRFRADGLKAYTQAILYVLTGQEVYRKNALDIVRIWEQMDPAKYEYFTDSHIHTGIPLNRMVTAAEILRYTSCADEQHPWTDADTQAFTDNLVVPSIETFQSSPDHFMNQHNYPLLGSMAGAIFMDDRALYDEKVEWFTVNATAKDQGFNGSVSRLFRWVDRNDATGEPIDDPHVQHVEMGRDQAHGGGDLTNAVMLSRMLLAQGTKVDPVAGTVSDAPDAVGPYEFLDDRILAAADYFWRFMQGYDTDWTPVAYAISPDGTIRDTYNHISNAYRGRYSTASFWEPYYYYTYARGADVAQVAPYYAEAYAKRPGPLWYYGGGLNNPWDNGDGGGDFWLYIPAEAAGEAVPALPGSATTLEVEDRYTHLTGEAETVRDGDTGYVRLAATSQGSKIAYLSGSTSSKLVAFRIRTTGEARMHLSFGLDETVTLPDTGGQWRYVAVPRSLADMLFIEVTGSGATVDIDHVDTAAAEHLTPPVFDGGTGTRRLVGYAGASLSVPVSATDAGGADTVTYSATGLPEGAAIDPATGTLTWHPDAAGTADVVVVASDGTTVTALPVQIDVATDRAAALDLATTDHDVDETYESASLAEYTAAVDAATALADGPEGEYLAALQDVVGRTAALRLVSPRVADGSLDYPARVVTSTAGARAANLVDGDNQSGTSYGQAVNLSHTFDFGPDYRVSATKFGFQSNIFADRLANSAVFGSDDGQSWTRLTPGVTAYTQDYNTLDVAPDLQDDQFRYLKVQLLEPQPDVLYGIVRNLFEMNEFHVYGDRHEIGNQVGSVSLSADSAVAGKIAVGDTAEVKVVARQALDSVDVTVQGVRVAATSEDGLTWSASAELAGVDTGTVAVAVDYTGSDGAAGPTHYGTTDGSKLFVAGVRERQVDVTALATVTASDKQWPGTGLGADEVGYLVFDGDPATYGDLNTGVGSYYVVDLGEGASVRPEEFLMLPRSGQHARLNGTYVQGSPDGQTWTDLTGRVTGAAPETWVDVVPEGAGSEAHYRYLRIINDNQWNGNVAEVEIYGDLEYTDEYVDSKVASTEGSTRASGYLYLERVAEIRAAMTAPDADRTALLGELLAAADLLVPQSTLYPRIEVERSQAVASSVSWDGKLDAADNGWQAFDGDPATSPDITTSAGWVQADLGPGGATTLGGVRLLPRSGGTNYTRVNGALVQGSNDGSAWDTLATVSGVTSVTWVTVAVASDTAYRYLRFYTPSGNANVAELELFERTVDRTLLELLAGRGAEENPDLWTEASFAELADALDQGTVVLDDAAATQPDVDAAADAIDTALTGLVPLDRWSASATYHAGDRVLYDGRVFVALWWTRGDVPGESARGAWAELGARVACDAGQFRAWTPTWVYPGGDTVVHDGHRWAAKWWSRDQEPGDAGRKSPWSDLGVC